MFWGPMIAIYLFLAGAAAGAYLTSSLISFKYPTAIKMRKAGRFIAPVLLAIGLVMLMLDAEAGLHNPLRFIGLLFNPRSIMTIGVYIICVFMPIALIVAFLEWKDRAVPRPLDIVGDVAALCLAGYTGFLLGDSLGVPLWHNSVLPALFIVSALTSGMALVVLAGLFLEKEEYEKMALLRPIHIVLAVLEVVLIAAMLFIASGKGAAGAESVSMITSGSLAPAFWVGIIGIGLVLPLVMDVLAARSSKQGSAAVKASASGQAAQSITSEAIGQVGVVIGGFLLRFVVVMAGVTMILF